MYVRITSVNSGVCIRTVYWFRVSRIYRGCSENNRRNIQYCYQCNNYSFSTVTSISYGYVMNITLSPVYNDHCIMIESDVDFNSSPFTITINAGAIDGRANISVTCDDEVERLESFDMSLTLTSSVSGITLGRNTSVGQIIDNTGNELDVN